MARPLFKLGQVVGTPGALDLLQQLGVDPKRLLGRHITGDWGDMDAEDRAANDAAINRHLRIFSSYILSGGKKVWVITEADRSVTTLLLPEDY